MSKPGVLYISYDGMLEPLGQSQVIAYLEHLADEVQFHLISFEKPADWADSGRRAAVSDRLARAGIAWHPLRYHKSPTLPATMFDIAQGLRKGLWLAARHKVRIVHARSYIPGVIALAVKRTFGARFLFDMRGFWADERVDAGLWRADGALYRSAKRVERQLLAAADHIVTLTHASEEELRHWPYLRKSKAPVSVIPTCADLDRFTIQGPPPRDPFVLGYLGSVSGRYSLDDILRCFLVFRERLPDSRLLIVNRGEHDLVRNYSVAKGLDNGAVDLIAAQHSDVPKHISRMSAGLALYKPAYSEMACAPTKLAEYLGCGVPCVGNAGIGDMASILTDNQVGVALTSFSEAELRSAVTRLLALAESPGLANRCRETALRLFSLEGGVAAYRDIYRVLLDPIAPGERSDR
jgi:glycosyltransferase involved in cell wall biosynthesis